MACMRSRVVIICPRGPETEAQGTLQSPEFIGLEQPAVVALRDQQLDLLGRVHVPVRTMRAAEQAQDERARSRSGTR